jgi:predicted kinase
MKKVIITRGLPGSGKSTWAKSIIKANSNSYKRINNDDLRAMVDCGHYSSANEKFINDLTDMFIMKAIAEGKHVIVDNTNLNTKHIDRIKQLVKGQAELVINDSFLSVPVEMCIQNDLKRANSVGKDVIVNMYEQYLKKSNTITQNPDAPKAIIVDIDGTLAHMKGRSPYDWHKVGEDECDTIIKKIVNSYDMTGGTVIVMSGRDGSCRAITEIWLEDNDIRWDTLLMREEGDMRKDSIVKRELFDTYIAGHYFIEYVLDDRQQVVDMWRDMGLKCLQVAPGNF